MEFMGKMKQTTSKKRIPSRLVLSSERAEEIMVELREGTSYVDIAKDFGVSRTLVRKINLGESYRVDGFSYPVHDRAVKQVKEYESLV